MGLTCAILPNKFIDQPKPDACLYACTQFGARINITFRERLLEDLRLAGMNQEEKREWKRAVKDYCTENRGMTLTEIIGNNNPKDWPMMLVFTMQ